MMTKEQLEAKIREAVPESVEHHSLEDEYGHYICKHCGMHEGYGDEPCEGRPLTLQDVLIALPSERYTGFHDGYLENGDDNAIYDLTKDYHSQSDEFYTFLHQLML